MGLGPKIVLTRIITHYHVMEIMLRYIGSEMDLIIVHFNIHPKVKSPLRGMEYYGKNYTV